MGKVSIIVAVYNGEKTLRKTIDSLLSQTVKDYEILLIDDGSTDTSVDIISGYLDNEKVKYHKKKNGGVASARNYGIEVSTGEFIGFCDQDDQWHADKIEQQLPKFDDIEVGLVYSWVDVWKHGVESISTPEQEGWCFEELLHRNFISCCTAMVRKSILERIGGFDESPELHGVDDRHVWLRVAKESKFAVVKKPLATYFIHGENYSLNEKKMWIADLICVRKIAELDGSSDAEKAMCRDAEVNINKHYGDNLLYQNEPQAAAVCYYHAWKIKPQSITLLVYSSLLFITPPLVIEQMRVIKKKLSG
ncbi:glycosyltransferase family 2 protein [Alteromonas sp. MMG017]|uniref:glycosyltransferase family 2 protein n=1 Tax=Alteromonas sp. MMG017 TaxID=2822692 RepID=UPI001B3A0983|nr:glycosyltransferase family 2 protein [Alteromonas sp. MMG017]